MEEFLNKINLLNFQQYNENISYCGNWSGNEWRSKLGLQKILPFNKFCFLHDKGYKLLTDNFKILSFWQVIKYKWIIDNIFYSNMKSQAIQEKSFYKMITARLFFSIVVFGTPIYYLGFKFSK